MVVELGVEKVSESEGLRIVGVFKCVSDSESEEGLELMDIIKQQAYVGNIQRLAYKAAQRNCVLGDELEEVLDVVMMPGPIAKAMAAAWVAGKRKIETDVGKLAVLTKYWYYPGGGLDRYYDLPEELKDEHETNAAVTEVKEENGGVPGSAIAGLVDAKSSGGGSRTRRAEKGQLHGKVCTAGCVRSG